LIDSVFQFLLECGAGLSATERTQYSNHSWRIYLACALYAAGCPDDIIMSLLRWRSREALATYARLNDETRAAWLLRAATATVDSTVAAHLPTMHADEWVATIQSAIQSGPLGAAARGAKTSAEIEID
jgi:hypothetical protein